MTAHGRRPSGSVARRPADLHPDRLLLAAESAVDIGARILRQGHSRIGALIAKGDRDFATNVDLQIESAIKASLAEAAPGVPFLGEEGGGDSGVGALWVLDPIDGTINFSRDSPLCAISLSLVVDGQHGNQHRSASSTSWPSSPFVVVECENPDLRIVDHAGQRSFEDRQ